MQESEVKIEVEEQVPSAEEMEQLELAAAQQLLLELKMIKKRIYESNTLINSVLIVQVKAILRSLIRKYNDYGFFQGENITLKLSNRSKYANLDFVYSQKLHLLFDKIVANLPKPDEKGNEND